MVTLYVYPAEDFDAALEMVDSTSEYALTEPFARERYAIDDAMRALENAAGNFTSTTSPPGRSWANSHSVAPGVPVPTTRPGPTSTCCAGSARAPSRKPSRLRGLPPPVPPGVSETICMKKGALGRPFSCSTRRNQAFFAAVFLAAVLRTGAFFAAGFAAAFLRQACGPEPWQLGFAAVFLAQTCGPESSWQLGLQPSSWQQTCGPGFS